jgi:hypothetical protein
MFLDKRISLRENTKRKLMCLSTEESKKIAPWKFLLDPVIGIDQYS